MNKKTILLITVFTFLAGFYLCADSRDNIELNYNNDLTMAILWQQNSGEYAALCYQAFNAGKSYLQSLPAKEKPAVVFDIDETMLDNSKYAAWMVKTGNGWSADTWEEWCNAADADAVPGALDFALFVQKLGIEVFYVSNRPASVTRSTIYNMGKLGFPNADNDHVFLMENTSDKNPRIDLIKSKGFETVLYAGDNLDDFDSSIRKKNNQARRAFSGQKRDVFGALWIVLPNPVYGTFEAVIKPGYYSFTPEEKASARHEMINSWAR